MDGHVVLPCDPMDETPLVSRIEDAPENRSLSRIDEHRAIARLGGGRKQQYRDEDEPPGHDRVGPRKLYARQGSPLLEKPFCATVDRPSASEWDRIER